MADEQQDEQQPVFAAQRIYLKDASYEAPNAPGIFLKEWEPEAFTTYNSRSLLPQKPLTTSLISPKLFREVSF